jgi:hypothetical protein
VGPVDVDPGRAGPAGYRHVIVPAIRGGATVMDSVFDEDD